MRLGSFELADYTPFQTTHTISRQMTVAYCGEMPREWLSKLVMRTELRLSNCKIVR
jgi:hypothetical protein